MNWNPHCKSFDWKFTKGCLPPVNARQAPSAPATFSDVAKRRPWQYDSPDPCPSWPIETECSAPARPCKGCLTPQGEGRQGPKGVEPWLGGRWLRNWSKADLQRVEQQENGPPEPGASGTKRKLLCVEGIEGGIPWDLTDRMPTMALENLIRVWKILHKNELPAQSSMRAELRLSGMTTAPKTPIAPEGDLIDLTVGNWT